VKGLRQSNKNKKERASTGDFSFSEKFLSRFAAQGELLPGTRGALGTMVDAGRAAILRVNTSVQALIKI